MQLARTFLTRKRVRVHATLLAALTWIFFVGSIATPGPFVRTGELKGGDFLQFYTAGAIRNAGQLHRLYELRFFWDKGEELTGYSKGHYLPIYPPQVAFMFAPFAKLPYLPALYVWWIFSLACYAGVIALVLRTCERLDPHRKTFIIAAAGFPPVFQMMGFGQLSLLLTLLLTGAIVAYASDRPWLAGVFLGLTAFKPQILASFLLVLLLVRAWRVISGAVACGALQLAAIAGFAGFDVVRTYVKLAVLLPKANADVLAVKTFHMHSLRGFWYLLLGGGQVPQVLWIASGIAVLFVTVRAIRKSESKLLAGAIICIAAMLINPHVYIYDLAILGPALAILVNFTLGHADDRLANIQLLVYGFFVALLLAPGLSKIIPLQFSVLVMVALVWQSRNLRLGSPQNNMMQAEEHPVGTFVTHLSRE